MPRQTIRAMNDGRTPEEDRFIALFCQGVPQGQAVAEAFELPSAKPSTLVGYDQVISQQSADCHLAPPHGRPHGGRRGRLARCQLFGPSP